MSSFLRNLHHGDNASAELIVWSLPKQKQRERGSTLFPSNAGSIQFEIGWLRNWEKLLAEILFVLTLRQLRPSCPEHFNQSRLKIQNPFTFRTSYWGSSKASWASWETDESIIFFIFETSVCLLNTLFLEAEHWSVTLRRQERIMFDCVSRCLFVGCYQCLSVIWGRPGLSLLSCTVWVRRRTCPGRRRLLSRSSSTCPTSSLQSPATSQQVEVVKWKTSVLAHLFRISFLKGRIWLITMMMLCNVMKCSLVIALPS